MTSLQKHRAKVVVAVFGLSFLLAVVLAGQYVYGKYEWATAQINEIEPRYARLAGLRDSAQAISQQINTTRAAVSRLGYTSERDAVQIGNELQQVVRRALQSAGLTVINSQVMPARLEAGVERIAVAVQSDGSLSALQLFMAAIQGQTPTITTESLNIQATSRNAPDGSPIVSVRQTLSVMRIGS